MAFVDFDICHQMVYQMRKLYSVILTNLLIVKYLKFLYL